MEGKIKRYMTIVRSLLQSIKSLECNPTELADNFREALLFNLTDMVAKTVTNPSLPHSRKFAEYIKRFCDWEDWDRVSLPQLQCYLQKNTSERKEVAKEEEQEEVKKEDSLKIDDYIKGKLASWPRSQPIEINIDPRYSDINEMWNERFKSNTKVKLFNFMHVNMLYAQRNNLIHEMRRKGGPQLFDNAKPHYLTFQGELIRDKETGDLKLADALPTFELFYPYNFYFDLLESSLDKVEEYLLDNNINPFDSYNFDSLWFDIKG